ncbi:hypothetical protein C8R42DRAFT_640711 [Lentinula raphanica]|nr:hypothetical protein C8R42DRAFT_640711 [Lentinula raphanica]
MSVSQTPSAPTTPTQPRSWMKRVKANKIVAFSPGGLHYATTYQEIIDMLEFDRLLRLPNAMAAKCDIPMSYQYFSTQVNNDALIHPAKFATPSTPRLVSFMGLLHPWWTTGVCTLHLQHQPGIRRVTSCVTMLDRSWETPLPSPRPNERMFERREEDAAFGPIVVPCTTNDLTERGRGTSP